MAGSGKVTDLRLGRAFAQDLKRSLDSVSDQALFGWTSALELGGQGVH